MTTLASIEGVTDLDELPVGRFRWVDPAGNELHEIEEAPIAGVVVSLQNEAGVEVARTRTDTNGDYRFDDLPVGQYTVVFTVSGAAPAAPAFDVQLHALPPQPGFVRTPVQTWALVAAPVASRSARTAHGRRLKLTGTLG